MDNFPTRMRHVTHPSAIVTSCYRKGDIAEPPASKQQFWVQTCICESAGARGQGGGNEEFRGQCSGI